MAKCKYDSETFPEIAEDLARQGYRDIDIAKSLGISEETFYQYKKKFPEFSEALKRGKAPVDFKVENALLKRAMGFTETVETEKATRDGEIVKVKSTTYFPPDPTSAIFWLKNRRSALWKDKHEISGDLKLSQKIEQVSQKAEEATKYYKPGGDDE